MSRRALLLGTGAKMGAPLDPAPRGTVALMLAQQARARREAEEVGGAAKPRE